MNPARHISVHFRSRLTVKLYRASRRPSMVLAIVALLTTVVLPQGESVEVQRARSNMIAAKRDKVFYTNKFSLDGLPQYKPEQKVTGTIRIWGLNYMTDGNVAKYWE